MLPPRPLRAVFTFLPYGLQLLVLLVSPTGHGDGEDGRQLWWWAPVVGILMVLQASYLVFPSLFIYYIYFKKINISNVVQLVSVPWALPSACRLGCCELDEPREVSLFVLQDFLLHLLLVVWGAQRLAYPFGGEAQKAAGAVCLVGAIVSGGEFYILSNYVHVVHVLYYYSRTWIMGTDREVVQFTYNHLYCSFPLKGVT